MRILFIFIFFIIAISDHRDRFYANNSAVATRFPNTFGEAPRPAESYVFHLTRSVDNWCARRLLPAADVDINSLITHTFFALSICVTLI